MIQHFCQAKMSSSNNSFHKSLHFSKSFKVFHCSVINVLLLSSAVFLSDSLFIIAPLSSFVNNFFHLFQKSFWGLPPGSLLPVFLFRFGARRLISDSFVILSCPASFVNNFFAFIWQYNQKSPITAQKLIIYKCLLHKQIPPKGLVFRIRTTVSIAWSDTITFLIPASVFGYSRTSCTQLPFSFRYLTSVRVTEIYFFTLSEFLSCFFSWNSSMTWRIMDAASSSFDSFFCHMRYPRGSER